MDPLPILGRLFLYFGYGFCLFYIGATYEVFNFMFVMSFLTLPMMYYLIKTSLLQEKILLEMKKQSHQESQN